MREVRDPSMRKGARLAAGWIAMLALAGAILPFAMLQTHPLAWSGFVVAVVVLVVGARGTMSRSRVTTEGMGLTGLAAIVGGLWLLVHPLLYDAIAGYRYGQLVVGLMLIGVGAFDGWASSVARERGDRATHR